MLQTYEVIKNYNNGLSNFANGQRVWHDPDGKGVTINEIDIPTAELISSRIKPCALDDLLPITYALACLAIESTLDPNANNGNLGVGESNTVNDPLGYDVGIAQLKLRYLIGYAAGCVDADTARAFALDVNRAIPYFCSLMAGKVQWAKDMYLKYPTANCDVRLKNPYLLATGAYNFGATGMLVYFNNGTFPSHCQHVINLETYFAKEFGYASIFANLPILTPVVAA